MLYTISDCHGDFDRTVELLQKHKVIDQKQDWSCGSSILINCGDTPDRGSFGLDLYLLWLKLRDQAKEQGGQFIHLMGNHDAMLLSIVLALQENSLDTDHAAHFTRAFKGDIEQAKEYSLYPDIIEFIKSFPLVCKIDNYLFQHCDGSNFIESLLNLSIVRGLIDPIDKINTAKLLAVYDSRDMYDLAMNLSCEFNWGDEVGDLPNYLSKFDCTYVVHGHNQHKKELPYRYADGLAYNVDASLSYAVNISPNRGCILELNIDHSKVIY